MFKLLLVSLVAVVGGISWAQTAPAPSSPSALVAGSPAPALSVRDANGTVHRLSDLHGKKSLLLTFFPRCFTGNCTSQLTSLRDAYPQLQKAGIEVWAVSTDAAGGPKGQRAFRKYLRLPFPLLPDPDRRLCLLFGAVHTKEQMAARMSVLINRNGTIAWIDKQISPRTHGQDVLAKVRAVPEVSPSSSRP